MAKSAARRMNERMDEKSHFFHVAWENEDGSFEGFLVRRNLGDATYTARSRGWRGYVIIETIGRSQPLTRGAIVYRDAS